MSGLDLRERLTAVVGQPPQQITPLSGGCIGDVYHIRWPDGRQLVAKWDDQPHPQLDLEAYMLRYLAAHSPLPVPEVKHSSPELLLLSYVPGRSAFSPPAEAHAAELLGALHQCAAPDGQFGLERDTLIGSLPQPNPATAVWVTFFRDHRLLAMAHTAHQAGRLPTPLLTRLQRLAERLDHWLTEPEYPALIHGDVWTTNVLAQGERITGFLDPAIYYAHPEMELSYITLFDSFGRPFFDHYQTIHPLGRDFFTTRQYLYQLYPLLVHVRLFGGSYVNQVAQILSRFGV